MGVLGEYPTDEMLSKLDAEIKKWQAADTTLEVQPALHYIAVTAQGSPGKGNKYRLRMPFKQIDSILRIAARINAIVFLDIQVGMSTVQEEIPVLENYLKMPQVHLGIDPGIFHEDWKGSRFGDWHNGRNGCQFCCELSCQFSPCKSIAAKDAGRASIHTAHDNQLQADSYQPGSADHHGYGWLGSTIQEKDFLPGIHCQRTRSIHRFQAVL